MHTLAHWCGGQSSWGLAWKGGEWLWDSSTSARIGSSGELQSLGDLPQEKQQWLQRVSGSWLQDEIGDQNWQGQEGRKGGEAGGSGSAHVCTIPTPRCQTESHGGRRDQPQAIFSELATVETLSK